MSRTDYLREWRAKNRDKVLAYKRKAYLKASAGYVVYTHTSKDGKLYVGMGNSKRPNSFANRREHHKAVFTKKDTTVRVLAKMETKQEARELEELIIETIGLQNLINILK
tara:strand:+ start:360 stop:689 length:330 start_codon:yes stop_codon:yes gene_type:complete